MASFVNVCRFNPVAGGTGAFVVSSAVNGYQTPALAGAIDATTYHYRAESADLTQWEVGTGIYTAATTTLTRGTVLYNSSGTGTGAGQSGAGTNINFSTVPQVAISALAEDLVADINSAWTTYAPVITSQVGAFVLVSATGRYKIVGKIVFISVTVTVGAAGVGTAAGQMFIPLPVNAQGGNVVPLAGHDSGVTGNALSAAIYGPTNATRCIVTNFNAATIIANSAVINIGGSYESA